MQYDPIKSGIGVVFNKTPWLRKLLYKLLDILLLRTWHVKKAIKKWKKTRCGKTAVLDAGSGFGQYSYWLAVKNPSWSVLATDIKTDQIDDCRDFFNKAGITNVDFQVADLTKFIRCDTFEMILSVDVMEHIEDDSSVFRNFWKSLKPGGMLLISTPSDQGGSDVHQHDHPESGQDNKSFIDEHVRDGYNIGEIQQKLSEAGFARTEALFTYGWPGRISWKLSMKYPIMMVNFSKLFFTVLPFYYLITYWFALLMNVLDVTLKHKKGTGLLVKAWK